jgi:membrane-associated phospholipid phosphatase
MDRVSLLHHMDWVLLMGSGLTALSLLGLLKWSMPARNPFRLIWDFVRRHAVSQESLFYALTLLGIMFLDILETRYDAVITEHLHWDFTPLFLQIEGPATGLFQLIHATWLTYALSAVYLYVFPVMGVVAMLAAYYSDEKTLARKLFWVTVFNYVLILPFYILVPVSERWAVPDNEVALLMNQLSPLLIEGLRPLSGLNNCFPSFHTSLATSFALLMSESSNRRLRRTMYFLAGLVFYSTLYLGFHWVLDAFAGVVFAAACSLLATWAVERYPMELAFLRSR